MCERRATIAGVEKSHRVHLNTEMKGAPSLAGRGGRRIVRGGIPETQEMKLQPMSGGSALEAVQHQIWRQINWHGEYNNILKVN